jgi:DNA-binding GntR family transcriptional regulator
MTEKMDPARVTNETLASQIRNSLADDITSGIIAPGSQIDEHEIAERFGASRTPVREALRELASSGLVTIEPRRGARVVELTLERIGEMFEVMARGNVRTYRHRADENDGALSATPFTSSLAQARSG